MIPTSTTIWEALRDLMMGWGMPYMWAQGLMLFIAFLVVVLFIIIAVLALTLLERRLIGWIQLRPGPNRVGGRTGVLQPIADALKLLYKEDIIPLNVDRPSYLIAPYVVFIPTMIIFVVLPFGLSVVNGAYKYIVIKDLNIGLAFILAMGSIQLIGIIMAGWGSGNKYALFGAMRAVAQLISYEVPMVLALISVSLVAGSLSMVDIVQAQSRIWAVIPLFPAFIILLITAVAETNRCPFDLPEAESEIVAGFHIEYSGMRFALFYLAEYVSMLIMSMLITICFFGGWKGPMIPGHLGQSLLWLTSLFWFGAKTFFFVWCFIWFRGTVPRIRVDQLMKFAWKFLLPVGVLQLLYVGWAITYRNPFFSAFRIPSETALSAYTGVLSDYKYMTLSQALSTITPSERLAFGWSILVALLIASALAVMLWRTYQGYKPSRAFADEFGKGVKAGE